MSRASGGDNSASRLLKLMGRNGGLQKALNAAKSKATAAKQVTEHMTNNPLFTNTNDSGRYVLGEFGKKAAVAFLMIKQAEAPNYASMWGEHQNAVVGDRFRQANQALRVGAQPGASVPAIRPTSAFPQRPAALGLPMTNPAAQMPGRAYIPSNAPFNGAQLAPQTMVRPNVPYMRPSSTFPNMPQGPGLKVPSTAAAANVAEMLGPANPKAYEGVLGAARSGAAEASPIAGRVAGAMNKIAPVGGMLRGAGGLIGGGARLAGRALPFAGAAAGAYFAGQNLKGMSDQFIRGNMWKGLGQGGAAVLNGLAGASSFIPGIGTLGSLGLAGGAMGLDAISKGASVKPPVEKPTQHEQGIVPKWLRPPLKKVIDKAEELFPTKKSGAAVPDGNLGHYQGPSPALIEAILALAPTALGTGAGALAGAISPGDTVGEGARRGAYTGAGLTIGGALGGSVGRAMLPESMQGSATANLLATLLPATGGAVAGNLMAKRRIRKDRESSAMRDMLARQGYQVG